MKLERPILISHSMGAATGMSLGGEYPELAQAIIMLDPGPGRWPPPVGQGEGARTGDSLAKIKVPALILKADAPRETRKVREEAATAMPDGRLVHIGGGGHNLHHDEPGRTVEVLNESLSTL